MSQNERPDAPEPETTPLEPPLPHWLRVLLFVVGSVLLLIGLVGLALPVIPQTIPLAAGAALLSLASDAFYRFLRTRLRRFPWLWKPIRGFRRRAHRLFSGEGKASTQDDASPPEDDDARSS